MAEVERVKPVLWMRLVRDAAPKFTTARLAVLWSLALRMRPDGTGFASTGQLAEDVGVDERTARRATGDARTRGYLNRTRRGHRLGNGTAVASSWELLSPAEPAGDEAQPLTDARLSDGSTGQDRISTGLSCPVDPNLNRTGSNLNRTLPPSQPDTSAPLRGLKPEVCLPEVKAAAARASEPTAKNKTTALVREHTDADADEAAAVVTLISAEKQPRSVHGLVRHLADAGELPDWLGRVRSERAAVVVRDAYADAAGAPECRHGVPGGLAVHPETGLSWFCALCRLDEAERQGKPRSTTDRRVAQALTVSARLAKQESQWYSTPPYRGPFRNPTDMSVYEEGL